LKINRIAQESAKSAIINRKSAGGQGRVRTSVGHMGRQIYSLLLLTAQPPVRKMRNNTPQTLTG
jgi:hypothetical protein